MPIFRERRADPLGAGTDRPGAIHDEVVVELGRVRLPGDLVVPRGAIGVVVFAHGSGSSHRSPRNVQVAGRLQEAGLGTLLFDLLTPDEGEDRANVFDITLLADRLAGASAWVLARLGEAPIGLFGASTGAAAALVSASTMGRQVGAVVSRGGRPDLAGAALASVTAPTLLIVGGDDRAVLELNREALARMGAEKRLEVVPGATHLFEEPGALERVAELAAVWFTTHLRGSGGRRVVPTAPDE
jgi:pimeloyl-ACP methyl ester carboxylesterase